MKWEDEVQEAHTIVEDYLTTKRVVTDYSRLLAAGVVLLVEALDGVAKAVYDVSEEISKKE